MFEKLISEIVDWMIEVGTTETDNGNYIIDYDEIAEKFNVPVGWIYKHEDEIKDEIDVREEILSETWIERYGSKGDFNMNFCLASCKDWDGTPNWGCLFDDLY